MVCLGVGYLNITNNTQSLHRYSVSKYSKMQEGWKTLEKLFNVSMILEQNIGK